MKGLHMAACAGRVEELKTLMQEFHSQIMTQRHQSMSLTCDSLAIPSQLPSQTDYVNKYNAHGMTALHGAIFHGQLESVLWLLEHGAAVNRQSAANVWTTPLHLAAFKGNLRLCRVLVEYGADACLLDGHGYTPQAVARNAGHKACAHFLQEIQLRQQMTPIRMELNYDCGRDFNVEQAAMIRKISYHCTGTGGLVALIDDHYSEVREEPEEPWFAVDWEHRSNQSYPAYVKHIRDHHTDTMDLPEGPWDEHEEYVVVEDASTLRRFGRRLSRRLTSSSSLFIGGAGDAEVSQAALIDYQ